MQSDPDSCLDGRIGPVVALKTERRRRRQGRLGHEPWPAPTMRLGRASPNSRRRPDHLSPRDSSGQTRTTGRVQVAGSFASQPIARQRAVRPASAIARGNAWSIRRKPSSTNSSTWEALNTHSVPWRDVHAGGQVFITICKIQVFYTADRPNDINGLRGAEIRCIKVRFPPSGDVFAKPPPTPRSGASSFPQWLVDARLGVGQRRGRRGQGEGRGGGRRQGRGRGWAPVRLRGREPMIAVERGDQPRERRNGLQVAFLARIADMPQTKLAELLPWNWRPELFLKKAA
jgi:hypothetical protein